VSMGAIVAGAVAMGWDDEEIDWRIRKAFVESSPVSDVAAPVSGADRAPRLEGGRYGARDPETERRIGEDRRPAAGGSRL